MVTAVVRLLPAPARSSCCPVTGSTVVAALIAWARPCASKSFCVLFGPLPGASSIPAAGSRATAEWSTGSYPVSRVIIAAQPLGRMALGAYQILRPLVRTVRDKLNHGNSTAEAHDAERERNAESESSEPLAI